MKISKIKIDSSFAKFEDGEILDLSTLSEKNQNRVFIYGSNGAGKSSLSKLFSIGNMKLDGNLDYQNRLSLLKTTNNDNPLSVKIYYNEEDYTEFNNDIIRPKRIPVFNKDYIDSKITYQTDFKNNKFQSIFIFAKIY